MTWLERLWREWPRRSVLSRTVEITQRIQATHVNPNWEQLHFRGRNDDVGLNATTFTHALDTNWTQDVDTPFRIRFEVEEDAGASTPTNPPATLVFSLNGGTFTVVDTASSVVRAVSSSQFANGEATTDIISGSGLTFEAGTGSTDGVAEAGTMSNEHTEMEYCVQIMSADVVNNDTIVLRINSLNVYTQEPTITVSETAAQTLTPSPVTAACATRTATVIPGAVTRTPSPVTAAYATRTPQVVTLVHPSPITAAYATRTPTVVPGALTVTPSAASAVWATRTPTIDQGGEVVTPVSVTATLATRTPRIDWVLSPASAAAAWAIRTPTLIQGGALTPSPVVATAATRTPTVVPGGVTRTPPPVIASTVTRAAVVRLTQVPSPATVTATVGAPTLDWLLRPTAGLVMGAVRAPALTILLRIVAVSSPWAVRTPTIFQPSPGGPPKKDIATRPLVFQDTRSVAVIVD